MAYYVNGGRLKKENSRKSTHSVLFKKNDIVILEDMFVSGTVLKAIENTSIISLDKQMILEISQK